MSVLEGIAIQEALIESRKTLDCQAMSRTRNSSYVIFGMVLLLKEVNSPYQHFCCIFKRQFSSLREAYV